MDNMDKEAKQITEQINNKKVAFFSALDEFKKYYVYYNIYPNYEDYNTHYNNSRAQLQTISSDIFQITNNIQRKIEEKNKSMASISEKLEKEKKINQGLNEIAKTLHGVKAGSDVMINDSKTEYNLQYYKNIEIFIGILVLLAMLVSPKASIALFIIFVVLKSGILQSFIPILGHLF
jgi:hypothetical protein